MPPALSKWDFLACGALLLVAFQFQAYCLYDAEPFVVLGSDAGNVAGFLAGWLYPDAFAGDLALDDRSKFASYVTLVLPIVALVHGFEPDLGRAYAYQMLPIVLVHACGFYFLGRRLFGSRGFAFALALLTLVPVWTISGDLWGIAPVPLVRMAYAAVFPWLILLCLGAERRAGRVFWFAGLAGLASYLHLVSGPSVAAGGLLGLLALRPEGVSFLRWLGRVCAAGLVYAAIIAPFAVIYAATFPSGSTSPSVHDAMGEWAAYLDVTVALGELVDPDVWGRTAWNGRWVIWLIGAFGLVAAAYLTHERQRLFRCVGLALVGILSTSIGIAYVDQLVNSWLGRGPLQVDLIRNLRYALPLLLAGVLFLVQQLWIQARGVPALANVRGVNVLIGLFLFASAYQLAMPYVNLHLPGFWSLRGDAAERRVETILPAGAVDALAYLAAAPERDARVLPLTADELGLAVRYAARKPVVWTEKDGNVLVYSSHPDVARWLELTGLVGALQSASTERDAAAAWCDLVRASGATLVLLDEETLPRAVRKRVLELSHVRFSERETTIVAPRCAGTHGTGVS